MQFRFFAFLTLFFSWSASAQTMYRCDVNGAVTYQESACKNTKNSREIRIPATVPKVDTVPSSETSVGPISPITISVPAHPPKWFRKNSQSPTIHFYYSPKGRPKQFEDSTVEHAITQALAAWDRGCNVRLVYRGISNEPQKVQSAKNGYWVVWEHSISGFVGGHGGPNHGVSIDSKVSNALSLQSTLVHEVGHVLGMPHSATGIMSPFAGATIGRILDLTDDEFRACNASIEDLYKVPAR